MRTQVRLSLLLATGVIWLTSVAIAQDANPDAELTAKIEQLVADLDADDFKTRENAEKALAEIGEPARAALTLAAKSTSPERSLRAARALKVLRKSGVGLRFLASARHESLAGAVTVALSPDGKFLYAPGFQANSMCIFARDEATGGLRHVASVVDADQLNGAVSLKISPDGKLAAAVSFRAKSVALFSRDAETGKLSLDAVRRSEPAAGLELKFPIDAEFSPDSRFLNVIDDQTGTVLVFDVSKPKRLDLVETQTGKNGCLVGARGLSMHPDGKSLYVTGSRANTLCVFSREVETGKLALAQVLSDEKDGIHALGGAFGVLASDDGKFVYVTSGRFRGDQAVSVYRVGADRTLKLAQEFIANQSDLVDFQGGNLLTISPDGRRLYAAGTVSCSLACFSRDPESGQLTYLSTLRDESTGLGSKLGANGVVCSPDGKFLYLALEDASAISVFEHKTQ